MNSKELIENIKIKSSAGLENTLVNKIQVDSRNVETNDLFVAIKGIAVDGHDFIESVIAKGASVIVCENMPEHIADNVCYVQVESTQVALGNLLAAYYDYPSKKMHVVGITGTNGKTTTATLLYKLFKKLGYKVGLLSTVRNYVDNEEYPATHTTPDSIQLYDLLDKMVAVGCEYCFMEVSSHAIHQHRVAGIEFKGAVFTNITHDHLDYHETFDEYITVKKKLFDTLVPGAFALVNNDDKNGTVMLQNTKAKTYTYSLKSFSDFKCKIFESHFFGMQLEIDTVEIWTKLIGEFNAYNLLSVYSTAVLLEKEKKEIFEALSVMTAVDGRFQIYKSEGGINAIIDYAHTPDALKNVLATICSIKTPDQNLITVVGAGGDRDKSKRPLMGNISAQKSDKVILTSDNPRSEDPVTIAEEMKAGIDGAELRKVLTIIDRKEAIRTALHIAKKGDIVLVAGKGHEDYQIIKGVKSHFDDREIVKEIFKEL